MIKSLAVALACLVAMGAKAQSDTPASYVADEQEQPTAKLFGHLDISISVGTAGVGIGLASHINRSLRLRAGFTYMPHITTTTDFAVRAGNYDAEGVWHGTNISQFAEYLEEITGYTVDSSIDMVREPRFNNFNIMLDIFPFHQKNWYASIGFFWGSATLGIAYNTTAEMTSLVSVGFYNAIYEKVLNDEPIYKDAYIDPEIGDRMMEYGRMGVRVGNYVDSGMGYLMEPDENNMVRARAIVNRFKPYVGIGYNGRLVKGDDRYNMSFECGVITWGGTPDIYTHDGTNLSKDVTNITGKVGRYVRGIKRMKAYPVLNVCFTRRIF